MRSGRTRNLKSAEVIVRLPILMIGLVAAVAGIGFSGSLTFIALDIHRT
jgi:hypothetical protein